MSSPRVAFKITGLIDTKDHVEFQKPCELSIHISGFDSITISGNGKLGITFKGSAESCEEADEKVAFWLDRLADLISYTYNAPASVVGVSSRECTDLQTGGTERGVTVYADTLIAPTSGEKGISRFEELALRSQSEECLDLQRRYRQALTEHSILMRYFLLYGVLESRFGSQGKIDEWIEQREQEVQKATDNHGNTRTIYTHIRNGIHPRASESLFPYGEVRKHIRKLQRFVTGLLDEACR